MSEIDIALICKAMGDTTRLQIIQMLSQGEKCACKLIERFDITQLTLSYHMKTLCECGLVDVRKVGKWSYYTLNADTISSLKIFVNGLNSCKGGDCPCP